MKALVRDSLVGTVNGLIIWAGHFVFVYAFLSVACIARWDRIAIAGTNLVTFVLAVATVLALVLIVVGAVLSLRVWQQTRSPPGERDERRVRQAFLSWLGITVSGIAFIAVLFVGLPILLLPPCH
jgi:hypothetical protein